MYAWGRSRINGQKHPEIAWAADTHYLSHLAATLDNQTRPRLTLTNAAGVSAGSHWTGVCVALSACAEKGVLPTQRNADEASHYLENFLACHDAALTVSQTLKIKIKPPVWQFQDIPAAPSSKQHPARFFSLSNHFSLDRLLVCFLCRVGAQTMPTWVPQSC